MTDLIGYALLYSGIGFFAAGSIGLLRLPDLLSRLHALTKADNLGLGLMVSGMALLQADLLYAVKLFLVWLLVLAAGAAASHAIAQQTIRRGGR